MDNSFLNWLGNVLNYSILLLIFIRSFDTACFSSSDMFLSAFGLIASILIFVVSFFNRRRNVEND